VKAPIDLENTVFSFAELLSSGVPVPMTVAWDNKNNLVKVTDFGTVFVGLEKVGPDFFEEVERAAVGDGPVFTAPEGWQWPQVARALGIFSSATQARKNGWEGALEPGFSFRQCRINKVKGEILVVVITDNSPWVK